MLKVKLIENSLYYKARKWTFILFILASCCLGIVSSIMVEPGIVWVIAFIVLFLLLGVQLYWNQKLKNSTGEKTLTWDNDYLRVKTKDQIIHEIPTMTIQQITLPVDPGIPMESMTEMVKEVTNQPKINYLEIKADEEGHRFEFDLDSKFMIIQLQKCLSAWERRTGKTRQVN